MIHIFKRSLLDGTAACLLLLSALVSILRFSLSSYSDLALAQNLTETDKEKSGVRCLELLCRPSTRPWRVAAATVASSTLLVFIDDVHRNHLSRDLLI